MRETYPHNIFLGKIDWHFAFHVRAFEHHTSVFMKLAKIIGILQLIPNWSPFFSLEVLVWISSKVLEQETIVSPLCVH